MTFTDVELRRCCAVIAFCVGTFVTTCSFAQQTYTYSYSNLLDGGLATRGMSQFDIVRATEEAFSLWSAVAPIHFVEVADAGPLPDGNDAIYSADGAPEIRIGHHAISDPVELAHAYSPGFNGLNQDVHFDSSNRTWSSELYFSVAVHEIGHTLGIDHFDDEPAIMNSVIGSDNLLRSIDGARLFSSDIRFIQEEFGAGVGSVVTERTWNGQSGAWQSDGMWTQGVQPTRFADVTISGASELRVSQDASARSVVVGGGVNQLAIPSLRTLTVSEDMRLGVATGGDRFIGTGDTARTLVPTRAAPADWPAKDFDAAAWAESPTGLGYDREDIYNNAIQTDFEGQLYRNASGLYSRLEFDVESPDDLDFLQLRMQYDDGFAAFLNGVRVASDNAPANLNWNSSASGSRDDEDALRFRSFDLSEHLDVITSGRNVLAIHSLNRSSSSSDMLMVPELSGGKIQNTVDVRGRLEVGGTLALAQNAASNVTLNVSQAGVVDVGGDVVVGDGVGRIVMTGGTLRVDGGTPIETFVNRDSDVRYSVPQDDSDQRTWFAAEADDSTWSEGKAALGYDREAEYVPQFTTDLEAEMFGEAPSVYTRYEFEHAASDTPFELSLRLKFDDGFVAYLNGEQVASRNIRSIGTPGWRSTAATSVEDEDAVQFLDIELENAERFLRDGKNVLAIHGLNTSANSSDFLLVPELTGREISGTVNVSLLEFWGGDFDGVERIVGQFEHRDGALLVADANERGQLEIDGSYRMHDEAELVIDVGNATTQLSVSGTATLAGSLLLEADSLEQLIPAVGQRQRTTLLEATTIVGEFAEVELQGRRVEFGHQQDGWFLSLVDDEGRVQLESLQASPGDATGDGRFDSSDLVAVFRVGQYEDDLIGNSDWTGGDWNGDSEFSTADLVWAFGNSTYLIDVAPAVPEPAGRVLLLAGLLAFLKRPSSRRA